LPWHGLTRGSMRIAFCKAKKASDRGAFRSGVHVGGSSSILPLRLLLSSGPPPQPLSSRRRVPPGSSPPPRRTTPPPQHDSQSPGVIIDPRQAATLPSVRSGSPPASAGCPSPRLRFRERSGVSRTHSNCFLQSSSPPFSPSPRHSQLVNAVRHRRCASGSVVLPPAP